MWGFVFASWISCTLIACNAQTVSSFYWRGGTNSINQVNSATWPGGRGGPAVFRKPDGSGLFMFGGNSTSGPSSDLWEMFEDPVTGALSWTMLDAGGSVGTYGTLNVASSTNRPGPRQGASTWLDNTGAGAFLFGGLGRATTTSIGYLNDLWYFNFATKNWTWIAGPQSLYGIGNYPPVGSNDPATLPRSRYYANVAQKGNKVYLFGGAYATSFPNTNWIYLNDFFIFDTNTREFTFVGGSNLGSARPGQYTGTLYPGGRESSVIWWRNDIFYMALGFGYTTSSTSSGYLQEVWSCNTADPALAWTLRSGTTNLNRPAVYGSSPLVLSSSVVIGSREDAVGFALSDGVFIVGGTGYSTSTVTTGWLADAFLYDESSNQWVWYGGTQGTNQIGTYSTVGQTGWPGGCAELATFVSRSGMASLLFGRGYAGIAGQGNGYLNAVWNITLPSSVRSVIATSAPASLSAGAIAGIVVGCVVGVALIILIIVLIAKKSSGAGHAAQAPPSYYNNSPPQDYNAPPAPSAPSMRESDLIRMNNV